MIKISTLSLMMRKMRKDEITFRVLAGVVEMC